MRGEQATEPGPGQSCAGAQVQPPAPGCWALNHPSQLQPPWAPLAGRSPGGAFIPCCGDRAQGTEWENGGGRQWPDLGRGRKGTVIEGERHREEFRREKVRKEKTGRGQEESWGKRETGRELQKEVGVLSEVTPGPMGQGCRTAVPLEKESLSRPVISCLVGAEKGGQLAGGVAAISPHPVLGWEHPQALPHQSTFLPHPVPQCPSCQSQGCRPPCCRGRRLSGALRDTGRGHGTLPRSKAIRWQMPIRTNTQGEALPCQDIKGKETVSKLKTL